MERVTVFMPVYNADKYLREAIDSILNQTYDKFKIIIVDDGSTDGSREILNSYNDERIRVVHNECNKGVAYTRNLGLELCDTEFIAFMDADDIAPLYRLKKQVEYLDEHIGVSGVGGYAKRIDERGKEIDYDYLILLNPEYIKASMFFENAFANGSMMLRMDTIRHHNIKYVQTNYAEDYHFFCQILKYGLLANMNETLQYYRVLNTGLTASADYEYKNQSLDRVHELNLSLYGIQLTSQYKNIFFKVFRENGKVETKEELTLLYEMLLEVISQMKKNNNDNVKMFEIACRKHFGKQVSKALFLW